MKRRQLRGALVGFGRMAENGHLPGWLNDSRVSIQAVCDPDAERRNLASRILPQARTYEFLEALLDKESLDFVDVCTPPPFHAAAVLTALGSKVHVLCEKPFVGTRADFRRIIQLSAKNDRIAFPVHNWKHAPIIARLRDWIREGRLGRILHSEFHTLRTQPAIGLTPWRGEKEEAGGGGILLDHGWHVAYLLMNFHLEAPLAVSAWAHPDPSTSGDAETSTHVRIEFPNAMGSMFLTWEAPRRHNSARVYGDQAFAILEDNRLTFFHRDGSTRTSVFRDPLTRGSHHPDWFGPVIDSFIYAMDHPDAAMKEIEEARRCLEIMLAGYSSMQKGGKRVPLSVGRFSTPCRKGMTEDLDRSF